MKLSLVAILCGSLSCLPASAPQAGVATAETVWCILNVAKDDAGKPAATVVADATHICGTDAATVARTLDSHHALAMREAAVDGGAP